MDLPLDYDRYVEALKLGRSYVSDGRSHLIDVTVEDVLLGTENSEVHLESPRTVTVTARASAYLDPQQDEIGARIAESSLSEQPYWHLERARVGGSRRVSVEFIVNGEPVARQEITADGSWNDVTFTHEIDRSSWVALRIYPSAHTNPIFVLMDGEPIREVRSAEWARAAVDQCWKMKVDRIREEDRPAARAAYDRAREVYDRIIGEARRR
jgi:hypothetical protein